MNAASPAYAENDAKFKEFHSLQSVVAGHLAAHPGVLRRWLESLPPRSGEANAPVGASKTWRTARLSTGRRRELAQLLTAVEAGREGAAAPLADWLLASVPVRTYLDMAEVAGADLRTGDPAAQASCRELAQQREALFLANYGLAKSAAFYGAPQEMDDRISAASCGLLDAIDRYVPGPNAARFGYFASYWIRYHLSRNAQKSGTLVAFPIHQHRLGRKIDRYLEERKAGGLPPPSGARVCEELHLGSDAYYWHQRRPVMVSLHGTESGPAEPAAIEYLVCDPAPPASAALEEAEGVVELERMLRTSIAPATRVMLAYTCGIGGLAEAAADYLTHLRQAAEEQLAAMTSRRF